MDTDRVLAERRDDRSPSARVFGDALRSAPPSRRPLDEGLTVDAPSNVATATG